MTCFLKKNADEIFNCSNYLSTQISDSITMFHFDLSDFSKLIHKANRQCYLLSYNNKYITLAFNQLLL